jgi:hypothetical protein
MVLDDHRSGSSVYNKGYSATREQAMADFKARWLNH